MTVSSPAPGVIMRPAAQADMAAVLELNNRAVPAVTDLTAESLSDLHELTTELVVAEVNGEVAGFLIMLDGPGRPYDSDNYAWFVEKFASFYYVDRIVVGEVHKGAGLGRMLYSWAIEHGADRYPVLCAEVNIKPRNDESLHFHDVMGFEAVGEQDTSGGKKRVVMLARTLT